MKIYEVWSLTKIELCMPSGVLSQLQYKQIPVVPLRLTLIMNVPELIYICFVLDIVLNKKQSEWNVILIYIFLPLVYIISIGNLKQSTGLSEIQPNRKCF